MRKRTERVEQRVDFLGEQDGPSEQALKAALLAQLLRHTPVERAYLARVGFGPGEPPQVALCLAPPAANGRGLLDHIGQVFAGQFAREAHLDIIFVNDEQETDLGRVCRPFYLRKVR
jgi:hypothetical protein